MFSKNGKFKLYFWSTMLVLTLGFGTFGGIKHYNDTIEERRLAKLSKKTSDKIIIEGNIASKSDEIEIGNLVTAILNDANSELKQNNNELTLTDKGKLIAAVKYMYLNDKLNFVDGLDNKEREEVIKKTLVLYGSYVKFQNDFSINYSTSFCGSTGFDNTLSKSYGDDSSTDTRSCKTPLLLFEVDKVRYDKNTYVASVYGAYADETQNDSLITEEGSLGCQEGEKEFYKNVKLFSDRNKTSSFYQTDITGCCKSSTCSSAGITKVKSALLANIKNNSYRYYLRFNKNDDGEFELAKIEYSR